MYTEDADQVHQGTEDAELLVNFSSRLAKSQNNSFPKDSISKPNSNVNYRIDKKSILINRPNFTINSY